MTVEPIGMGGMNSNERTSYISKAIVNSIIVSLRIEIYIPEN